mgnify:FL=1
MKTIELFTTPLFHCNIDSTRELLPKLEEYALHQEKYKSGRNVSNVNGGHQTPFLSTSEEPLYHALVDKLKDEIKSVLRQWNFNDKLQATIGGCWININRKGHLNMPHMHPECDFAGIYYIKADEKTPIGFLNPDVEVKHTHGEKYIEKNNWSSPHFMFYPKDNDFIMFPGQIEHWVDPNWADTPRISLAFNIKIV